MDRALCIADNTELCSDTTRTAPRAISLENHLKTVRYEGLTLQVIGPEKRVGPILGNPGAVSRAGLKGATKVFQVWVEEPLGTDSHRTTSKRSRECWFLIAHKKCFVLLCPIGQQFLLSSFREFVHDGYYLATVARFVHQAFLTRNEGTTDESKNVSDAISRSNSICTEKILFLTDHNVS